MTASSVHFTYCSAYPGPGKLAIGQWHVNIPIYVMWAPILLLQLHLYLYIDCQPTLQVGVTFLRTFRSS